MRAWLLFLIGNCNQCRKVYEENVPLLIADDDGTLADDQVEAVLAHLMKVHDVH